MVVDMKPKIAAVILFVCRFQIAWGSNSTGNNALVYAPICEPLPDEYAACRTISNRRSTHYYEHVLPDINNNIGGHAVDIGLAVLQRFNPPPPQECTDFVIHFLCFVAVPPCDSETGLPMLVCNESCMAYERLLAVDYCRQLDDDIRDIQQTSTFPDLRAIVDRYFEIDCYNISTYIFEPNVTEFSSQTCTHLFTPTNLEQILSRPSCQRVPSGLCSSLAETGFYIPVPNQNTTVLLEEFASVNTSLLLSCQTGLLKLACNYYYPPCDPVTFQQRAICRDSCESVALIQRNCPSVAENLSLPGEILGLDCFNPSSYLVENVTVSQDQCIDLSTYAMNLIGETQSDVVALAIGLSIGMTSVILLSVLILIGCFIQVYKRQTKKKIIVSSLIRYSNKNVEASVNLQYVDTSNTADSEVIKLSKADKESYINLFSSILISHTDIVKDECIGQGAFGKVYKGELYSQGSDKKLVQTVAIKTIKNVSSQDELKAFFAESLIMKDFHHPNVLSLAGVCFDTPDGYPFLILPFMVNGSLKDYLKKHRVHVTDIDTYPKGLELPILVRMCMDISCGMAYLAEKKFVHRDLAARNCMVGDGLRIKVGDFGLTRDVYSNDYYRANKNAKLPVKWMSPEALHDNISNEKTDVWSFGVTCWEVFSLGRTPYPSIQNHELVKVISSGIKLEKPNLCPSQIYTLIIHCWEILPDGRPTFSELSSQLSDYWEEQHAYS